MSTFSSILKNIFFLLLILQFTPLLLQSIRKNYSALFEQKTKVAVLPIKGMILSSTKTIKQMRKFFEESNIKAIVIKMECPGGAAGSSQAIYQELKKLKGKHVKPVIVWVENMCASGGYYIASGADYIFSTPSAFIGSIGVYIPLVQVKELLDLLKVNYQPIVTGSYKLAADPFTNITSEQREMLQNLTQETYDQFVKDVAQSRSKLALADAPQWAQGRIFTGTQAVKMGLVDSIGTLSDVEAMLKEKITVVGKIEYVHPPKSSKLAQLFGSDDDEENSSYIESAMHSMYNTIMQSLVTRV